MLTPQFLQGLAQKLCVELDAAGVVLALFHTDEQCELVTALRQDAFRGSLRDAFLKMAERADEGRPDEQLAGPAGANRPGDVFRIRTGRWAGVLVEAREIHPEGIVATARVPAGDGTTALPATRLTWAELQYVGHPSS